jgi:hypothetical protein
LRSLSFTWFFYPQEVIKSQDNARFEKFIELLKNLCLQIPLVDPLKLPPYSKYMKDIVTYKIKIPSEAITTMLVDYSFEGKMPKKERRSWNSYHTMHH